MAKFTMCIEKKNGLVYKSPLISPKEEDAIKSVSHIYDAIKNGQKHYFLAGTENRQHTFFTLDEISCVYYTPVDEAAENREKEEKELRLRMLRAQVDYYESLAAGEAWKKNPYE